MRGTHLFENATGSVGSAGSNDITMVNGNAGDLAKGDAVYQDGSNNQVDIANASAIATGKVMGLCAEPITAGMAGDIRTGGRLDGVLVGATAGLPVFLSLTGTTTNTLTQTIPINANEYVIEIGVAINATDIEIAIKKGIEL